MHDCGLHCNIEKASSGELNDRAMLGSIEHVEAVHRRRGCQAITYELEGPRRNHCRKLISLGRHRKDAQNQIII